MVMPVFRRRRAGRLRGDQGALARHRRQGPVLARTRSTSSRRARSSPASSCTTPGAGRRHLSEDPARQLAGAEDGRAGDINAVVGGVRTGARGAAARGRAHGLEQLPRARVARMYDHGEAVVRGGSSSRSPTAATPADGDMDNNGLDDDDDPVRGRGRGRGLDVIVDLTGCAGPAAGPRQLAPAVDGVGEPNRAREAGRLGRGRRRGPVPADRGPDAAGLAVRAALPCAVLRLLGGVPAADRRLLPGARSGSPRCRGRRVGGDMMVFMWWGHEKMPYQRPHGRVGRAVDRRRVDPDRPGWPRARRRHERAHPHHRVGASHRAGREVGGEEPLARRAARARPGFLWPRSLPRRPRGGLLRPYAAGLLRDERGRADQGGAPRPLRRGRRSCEPGDDPAPGRKRHAPSQGDGDPRQAGQRLRGAFGRRRRIRSPRGAGFRADRRGSRGRIRDSGSRPPLIPTTTFPWTTQRATKEGRREHGRRQGEEDGRGEDEAEHGGLRCPSVLQERPRRPGALPEQVVAPPARHRRAAGVVEVHQRRADRPAEERVLPDLVRATPARHDPARGRRARVGTRIRGPSAARRVRHRPGDRARPANCSASARSPTRRSRRRSRRRTTSGCCDLARGRRPLPRRARRRAAGPRHSRSRRSSASRTARGSSRSTCRSTNILMGERHYYPIYEAAQHYGLPILVHPERATETILRTAPRLAGAPTYYIEWHTGSAQVRQSNVISLVCHGVFERFPKLKYVIAEGGFAWAGDIMWRLDTRLAGPAREVPWVKRRRASTSSTTSGSRRSRSSSRTSRSTCTTLLDMIVRRARR